MPRRESNKALGAARAVLRAHVHEHAQPKPAVYWMSSADGEILYVGKSKRLRARLLSYFRNEDDKAWRILSVTERIEWTYVPSEFAALLEEMRRIKKLRPRFNVALKRDDRHYAFIRLTDGRAPRLTVVRGPGRDAHGLFYGPFMGAERLREAVRELSDVLGLRDCTLDGRMRFADQRELFVLAPRTPGCLRYEIGRCLGPCVAATTAAAYMTAVREARSFLEGTSDLPVRRLTEAMEAASTALEYERAASLRDKLARLTALRERFDYLRFAVESLSFTYSVPGVDSEDRVYVIHRGKVVRECPAPRDEAERRALADLAALAAGSSPQRKAAFALPAHEVDELLLISSWFARHPDELARTVPLC
ncbi:MAG TPA: UvrB/UvrC motif-containing protein [Gemmatimonadaceae bacterium]|nr:UvrB/UvrC motif-containing protein [Gemmatimonadaceae bacterium]